MSAATQTGYRSLFAIDAAGYAPHAVHGPSRTYQESNCYTDIVIELLHARGDEPLAALGSLVRMDFEGDQWSFFKPSGEDLERLFGIDIHEMQPYRALPEQIAEQIDAGRTIAVELDSWFLPDTHATSYRREHVKSSVIAEAIDLDRCWLRYFHGPGLFELEGEDYAGVFRSAGAAPEVLPPYTELVRFDAGPRLSGEELRDATRASLRGHLAHRPQSDPFERFAAQLERELPSLLDGDAEDYHAYAFATVRMVGAAFELAAAQADWLFGAGGARVSEPMLSIVEGSKVLSFRLARRRSFDPAPVLASLSDGWHAAMSALEEVLA
ncbi:MAG TPA: DUF1839 family protein [Solirubrobacteraceae bacterium]|jgi:hypothetical protein|nr:DUF1839 family protein [Solirubrobacteraceae bacterium]